MSSRIDDEQWKDLCWALAVSATAPIALAHPLTFVGFMFFMQESFTRDVETNVDELTWSGRLAWFAIALAVWSASTAVAYASFRLRRQPFRRFASAYVYSRVGYLSLAPLAFLMMFHPYEGNIVGFFYVPYYLLCTAVSVTFSIGIQAYLLLVRRPAT